MTDDTEKPRDDDALLELAREQFKRAVERERDNRKAAEEDIEFALLNKQWPEAMKAQREREGRPCLTVNVLAPAIKQVVNDARQNKPAIKVLPQDSKADPETAEVMSGLIRNIEASSDADVAYDTAIGHSVAGGFGYFRVNLRYACDDNWEQDLVIERVADPLSVYGDPDSTSHDSSDWNVAFVVETMSKAEFKKRFGDRNPTDFAMLESLGDGWCEGDQVRVVEWWTRKQVTRKLTLLSDGSTALLDEYEAKAEEYQAKGVVPAGKPRPVMSYEVTQRRITGAEVLETVEWAGKFIPIVPVYGDDVVLGGKRHLLSLIRHAKDEQRRYNYSLSQATEMISLAPKAPFIGPEGAFDADEAKWATANTATHAFIEYSGNVPPQRVAPPPIPSGFLQEALGASDNIKRITGIHDASLGMRSNETSGRAIMARQREGDVSTFNFIDNLSRAIRHAGRILIDLIPKVYSTERMVRVLGVDGTPQTVAVGPTPQPGQQQTLPAGFERMYDLGLGKYDLTVTAGPSFTTRREEAAVQMTEFIRAYPAAAPIIGDLLAKNLDWPGAEEMEKRLQAMLPPQVKGEQAPDPEKAQMAQTLQQGMAQMQALQAENDALKQDRAVEAEKLRIDAYKAESERMKIMIERDRPTRLPAPAFAQG